MALNTENLSTLKIHNLSQKQYDRELKAGRIDETALYLTPDNIVRHVTEKGESNGIKYCKYNDGTAECWGVIETVTISSYGTADITDKLPLTFTKIDHCSANIEYRASAAGVLYIRGYDSGALAQSPKVVTVYFGLEEGTTRASAAISIHVWGEV